MRILIVNKFLYPNGGSETYIFKLGKWLKENGHEVEYFGMEHEGMIVGNKLDVYTTNMDFHGGSIISKLTYPFKTIYSVEARKKIRMVLNDFKPDVVHLNNFNYQLTPSIILEIRKWNKNCRIIYTAHDGQLVCPNHLMQNPKTHKNCDKCLNGNFMNCIKGKCIHESLAKSLIGAAEAKFWDLKETYKYIDTIICCSKFMKNKLDCNKLLRNKTVVLHNFVDQEKTSNVQKKDYVLYFGRFSEEKGVDILAEVCKEIPDISFIFAGKGPLQEKLKGSPNITNVGFKTGKELEKLISEARFSICPSTCYENCPFSVMESQMLGTPVLGANIGGIPELIEVGVTGELFTSGDKRDLKLKIKKMYNSNLEIYSKNCQNTCFDSIDEYGYKILKIYNGDIHGKI